MPNEGGKGCDNQDFSSEDERCGAVVEYRCSVIDQDGDEMGQPRFSCGDGDCLLQNVAYLLTHTGYIDGVIVRQWVA